MQNKDAKEASKTKRSVDLDKDVFTVMLATGNPMEGSEVKWSFYFPQFVYDAIIKRYTREGGDLDPQLDLKFQEFLLELAFGAGGDKNDLRIREARNLQPLIDDAVEQGWVEFDRQSEEWRRQQTQGLRVTVG